MSILTLSEAQTIITGVPSGTLRYDDDDIQVDIDTAEGQIAEVVGPLTPTSVTETAVVNHLGAAVLPRGPYIGPTAALSVDGREVSPDGVRVDGFGIVRGIPGPGVVTITYMAGWLVLPAPVAKAIRDQFRHVWSRRRGNTRGQDSERGAAHAMPYIVSEAIEPYRWGGGFA